MNEWLVLFLVMVKGFMAFVATNIDNVMILLLLLSQNRSKRLSIIVGQYLGFALIIALSILGSFSKMVVPLAWIGLLGVIPIASGIKKLFQSGHVHAGKKAFNVSVLSVTVVTLGSGVDNISTYTPLFAHETLFHISILIFFFFILLSLILIIWYYQGYASKHLCIIMKIVGELHRFLPLLFIVLGILIIYDCGTFRLLLR